MYSQKIVERNLSAVQDSLGVRLVRYDDSAVDDITAYLINLVESYNKEGKPEKWKRQPTKQEWDYINNERVMCKFDFSYAAMRYFHINLLSIDGRDSGIGRLGTVGFMRPQEVLLYRMAKTQEHLYDTFDRGLPVDGIRYFVSKSRQQHYTALCRMLSNHRTFFWPDTQAIGASINDDMVHELYVRDQIMYDRLPWFLKPYKSDDIKNQQLGFRELGSEILYHQANQRGGMGTGRSIKVAHMTECSLWDERVSPGTLQRKLDNDLFPAIPQDLQTLYVLESTANGIGGWWYDQIDLIRKGKSLFELMFCPFYASDKKNRREPPEGWEPLDYTKEVANRVVRTSPAYFNGQTIRLDRQQMYWYESTMRQHERRLGEFFTNYPVDITESFQNFGESSFDMSLLTELRRSIGTLHNSYDLTTAYA